MTTRPPQVSSPARRLNRPARRAFSFTGALLLSALGIASSAQAQEFPFPSTNVNTANGNVTTVLTSHELRSLYNDWRNTFIESCPQGDARMRYPESGDDTRSEGVGYGMVIAAYMGDQDTFDGLWSYYKRASPSGDASSLMHWRRDGCNAGGGGGDTGSASDADIDAAFGLIVAERQFPGNGYGAEASQLVATIRNQLFQGGCPGILTAGSQFSDCGCINPSYIPPGYYVSFADADQAQFWDNARDATYTYFSAVSNNNTGLVPAWSASNGGLGLSGNCQPQVSGGGNPDEFQADAARTPWRAAADLLWTGDARARTFLQDIAGFATSQPIAQIVDRYSLTGQALNGEGSGANLNAEGTRSTFTMGGFATAMTASSQENLDQFVGAWQSLYLPGDSIGENGFEPRAFNTSLALLYGLTVTGFAWDPAGPAPAPVQEPVRNPPPAGDLLANGDFDEGILGWELGMFGEGASEGFAMHRDGELHLRIQEQQDDEPYNLQFYQTVNLQPGNYRMTIRARAAQPRTFALIAQEDGGDFTTYGSLINRFAEDEDVILDTQMREYTTVFEMTTTDPAARFAIQFGHSLDELIIDDVSLVPTTDPPSVAGEAEGEEPPAVNDGTTDQTPDNGGNPGSGSGNGSDNGGVNGTIDNNNDSAGSTGGSSPVTPSEEAPPNGLPPTPSDAPGNQVEGVPCTPGSCGDHVCSVELGLCYEDQYGYVWNPAAGANGNWTQPPEAGCGEGYVYWPLVGGCYDPVSGYAYNPITQAWEYKGDYYTAGQDDDGGCSVGAAGLGSRGHQVSWAAAALALLGLGFSARRRARG